MEILLAYDAETISIDWGSWKTEPVTRNTSLRLTSSPGRRPSEARAAHKRDNETRGLGKARQRSGSGPRATSFLRARPINSAGIIPTSEFVAAGRRFLEIEEFLTARCPCCGAAEANTRHHDCVIDRAPRAPGARALPRFKSIIHSSPSGKCNPVPRKQGFPRGHCYRGGGTPKCYGFGPSPTTKRYYSTSRLQIHKRGSTCGQAALTETDPLLPLLRRAGAITTLVRDRCSSTSAATNSPPSRWKAFGASENEGSDRSDQVAASMVGMTDGSSLIMARKGVGKERLFQIISATAQVAILRGVNRYRLILRDCQAARGREKKAGGTAINDLGMEC